MRRARPRRQTPCFRWQGVSNLRPPTWKYQAQTTGPPRRVVGSLTLISQLSSQLRLTSQVRRSSLNSHPSSLSLSLSFVALGSSLSAQLLASRRCSPLLPTAQCTARPSRLENRRRAFALSKQIFHYFL
uniref:Uncharacterized protein n=1 Tax=Solanum tuberosum TaxID=4113 RepID=M1DWK1_SOLTU